MTDRDRLIELLDNTFMEQYDKRYVITAPHTADHLLANGVIVQEWISVEDRLPDVCGDVLTYSTEYGDIELYYYMGHGEFDHHRKGITDAQTHGFTHWTPLPNPPKDEAEKALKEREGNG